jgi:hypothetical protein
VGIGRAFRVEEAMIVIWGEDEPELLMKWADKKR